MLEAGVCCETEEIEAEAVVCVEIVGGGLGLLSVEASWETGEREESL